MKQIKLLELFSGVGGFAKGLLDAGIEISKHYFSEIDKHAIANYRYNFKNAEYIGSVINVRGAELERPNIITFGSPCQDFSLAGNRLGMEGQRSSLILHAIRLITECRPDIFIWENVKGAFSSNDSQDFWGIIQAFANIGGYRLEWQLLNTAWFLPQNRERIYLIGHLDGFSECGVFPIGEANEVYSRPDADKEEIYSDNRVAITQQARQYSSWCGDFVKIPAVKQINTANKESGGVQPYQQNRIYSSEGIIPSLLSDMSCGTHAIKVHNLQPRSGDPKKGGTGPLSKTDGTAYCIDTGNTNAIQVGDYRADEGFRWRDNQNSPTLQARAREDGSGQAILKNESGIRRLTEIECERLQGYPDADKYCIFTLWKNHYVENQNSYANAESQNHKSQKPVGSAEKIESKESVKSAQKNTSLSGQQKNKPAQKSVHIFCGGGTVEIRSCGELLFGANNVANQSPLFSPTHIESFALHLARINSIAETIIANGEVGLHPNEQRPIQVKNGNLHVNLFGKEIMQPVNSAIQDTHTTKKHTKSTILNPSQKENLDTQFQTSFCYVMGAIRSFIPKEIPNEDSFEIQLHLNQGWTEFGLYDGVIKRIPKTQRYKLCGNAVTVRVVKEIGMRLKMVA